MYQAFRQLLKALGSLFFGVFAKTSGKQSQPIDPPQPVPPPPTVNPPSPPPPPTPTPMTWPHGPQSDWWAGSFAITQEYGCTDYAPEGFNPNHRECPYFHEGIDFALPCGTPIYAAMNLYVRAIDPPGYGPPGNSAAIQLFDGNADHWLYHMHDYAVHVGQSITKGTLIGHSGTRGYSTGCHIHFEVRPNNAPYRGSVDPRPWLKPT